MAAETIIRPNQRGLALSEAYARRELLYFLIWRDIKIRYKQTVLGVVWAVLVPVIQLVIFSIIFGRLAGISPDGDYPYPVFVLAGLVPWTFFAQSVTQGGQSLVNQQHLLTKIYFPRLFVPTGAVGGCFVDFLVSLGVLAAVFIWFRYIPSVQAIWVPALVAWMIIVSLSAAWFLSALTVAYRDFRYVVPLMVQSLLFLSPVVYPATIVPQDYRWVYGLNPMAGIIEGFRSALLGKPWELATLLPSLATTLLLVVVGAMYFRSTERKFADIA